MDYSGLSNAELTQLLTTNKIKGRASATTKAQKLKLLNEFFGVKESKEEQEPQPPKRKSPSPSQKRKSLSPVKEASIKPIQDFVLTEELIKNVEPEEAIIYLTRIFYKNPTKNKPVITNLKKIFKLNDRTKQKEMIQNLMLKYIGEKVHEKEPNIMFYTPHYDRFNKLDNPGWIFGQLTRLKTPLEMNAVLTQFVIPRDVVLNDSESIVNFIYDVIIKAFPKANLGSRPDYKTASNPGAFGYSFPSPPSTPSPPRMTGRKRVQNFITLENDELPCIDLDTERLIEEIIYKFENSDLTKADEEDLKKQIKKLSIKIHPDKNRGKPYEKRCEELLKILTNYLT
jgi:hypothetical protein